MEQTNQQQPINSDAEINQTPEWFLWVPVGIIRWLLYALMFSILLLGLIKITGWAVWIGVSLVLGHFSSLLNKILDK